MKSAFRRRWRIGAASLVAVLAAGCAAGGTNLLGAGYDIDLDRWLAERPLDAGRNIRSDEVDRGAAASLHVVQVRDREEPHRHRRYDLTVTVLRGRGTLWIEGVPYPMHVGDTAFVGRGTGHYFVNRGRRPAVALVTFAPAFTELDQEPAAP